MDNNGNFNNDYNDNQYFRDMQNKSSEEDIRAIKNRIRDSVPQHYNNNRRNEEEPSNNDKPTSGRDSDLEKDGLESNNDKKDTKVDGKNTDKKDSSGKTDGKKDGKSNDLKPSLLKDDKKDGLVKSKFAEMYAKFKKYLIAIAAFGALFLAVLIFVIIAEAYNSLTNAITNFYGVPEENNKDVGIEGFYTSEEYLYEVNGENKTIIGYDALIDKLNQRTEDTCKDTIFTKFSDWFTGKYFNGDVCKFLRYLRNLKSEYNKDGKDLLDVALIISSIFYGYDTKADPSQYVDSSGLKSDETQPSEHFTSLREVLSDSDYIKKDDVDDLAKYSIATTTTIYYEYKTEDEYDDDKNLISRTAKCERKVLTSVDHNLDKWLSFMRFGKQVADMFDEEVLTIFSYDATEAQCINEEVYSDETLYNILKESVPEGVEVSVDYDSVHAARKELEEYEKRIKSAEAFYQSAKIYSQTKDTFRSYNGVTFDYRNGFAYNKFPGFKIAIEDSNIRIKWDDLYTVKEVERVIQDVVSKKKDINDVLKITDPDTITNNKDVQGLFDGKVDGQSCGDYLSTPLSDIKVTLTDCNRTVVYDTVTFEDYIIGVTNGEVSNRNDNYVLAAMLAEISYALRRNNNYQKLPNIRMRSGNCDQVYCNPKIGCENIHDTIPGCSACHTYKPGGSHGHNPSVYTKYQSLYEIASDYLVVADGKPYNCGYNNKSQQRWYKKASEGMSFTQIIQEEYGDKGAKVIRCSDQNVAVTPDDDDSTPGEKIGNIATEEYPEVSPDKGKYYGFAYKNGTDQSITINPAWKEANIVTISPKCSNTEFANMSFKVNKQAQSKFEKALEGMCKLLTDGVKISDGTTCKYTMSDFSDGTVFIERKTTNGSFDSHAYGIAQDWNYSKTYTIGGTTYKPYNTRDLTDYKNFIQAIGGNEENCQNVNYILWKYAYKDAGFQWGGNYGRNGLTGSYDGKLFEIVYE